MANGQSSTLSAGTATPSETVPVIGSEGTSAAGSVVKVLSVALTGAAIALAQGSLTAERGRGQAAALSQGDTVVSATVALSGSGITSEQSSVIVNSDGTVPLVGSSGTFNLGEFVLSWGQDLTGSESTGSPGAADPTLRPTDIVGQSIATESGTTTAQGDSPVTVHISGVELAVLAGSVSGGETIIAGNEVASSSGSTTQGLSVEISGIESVVSAGNIQSTGQDAVDTLITSGIGSQAASIDVAVSGSDVTSSLGTLEVTGDSFETPTGQEATCSAGTLIPGKEFPVSGVSATFAQYSVGAPGGATLTGEAATVTAGDVFTTNDREFSLTGQEIASGDGTTFASSLAFVAGQELASGIQEIGPRAVALSGVETTSETGSVSSPLSASGGKGDNSDDGWAFSRYRSFNKQTEEARKKRKKKPEPSFAKVLGPNLLAQFEAKNQVEPINPVISVEKAKELKKLIDNTERKFRSEEEEAIAILLMELQ